MAVFVIRRRKSNDDRQLHLADHHHGGAALAYVSELHVPRLPDYVHPLRSAQRPGFLPTSMMQQAIFKLPTSFDTQLSAPDVDDDDVGPLKVSSAMTSWTAISRAWRSLSLVSRPRSIVVREGSATTASAMWADVALASASGQIKRNIDLRKGGYQVGRVPEAHVTDNDPVDTSRTANSRETSRQVDQVARHDDSET